jgi:hypothetical protein
MAVIHYAVEIFLPDIESENSAIGMVVDSVLTYSVIRLVTDRPQYDGSTITPHWEDDSDNTDVWYEGILSRDGMTNPNRQIDLTRSGDYATMSGFSFSVVSTMISGSTESFKKNVDDEGIYFNNRKIKLYAVIDNKFYSIWQGVISETSYTDTEYTFNCTSDFKTIHKAFPPYTINDATYPNAVKESNGKIIPVCLGRVPYARIYNISGNPNFIPLVEDSAGNQYDCAQATELTIGATGNVLTLKTPRMAPVCTGYYLVVVAGGGSPDTKRCYKIIESTNVQPGTPANNTTLITLDDPLDVDLATFNADYVFGETYANIWQFKVLDIGKESIVSNGPISSFKTRYNRIQAFDYDQQAKQYIGTSTITSGTIATPTTVTTDSNIVTIDGIVNKLSPVDITVDSVAHTYTWNQPGSPTLPTAVNQTGEAADCADLDRGTGYYVKVSGDVVADVENYIYLTAKITMPLSYKERSFDKLWFLVDYTMGEDDGYDGVDVYRENRITVTFKDQYDVAVTITKDLPLATDDEGELNRLLLPDSYYENNGDANSQTSMFGYDINDDGFIPSVEFEIPAEYITYFKNGIFKNSIEIKIRYTNMSVGSVRILSRELELFEVGAVIQRDIDTIGTELYTRVSGEYVSSPLVSSDDVYGAFYKILVDYDGLTVDSGDATTDVDTTNTSTYKITTENWYIGRQITEQRNSFEYLKELCAEGWCCMWQDRLGQKKLKSWRDGNTYPHSTHDESIIIRDSFYQVEKTKPSDTYNEFFVRYNYDPETGKCIKSFYVTRVDQDEFPEETDEDSDGNLIWKQWVGGVDDYTTATALWGNCHDKWLISKLVTTYSVDLKWFQDLRIYEDDLTYATGTGVNSAAYKHMTSAITWMGADKNLAKYSVALTASNLLVDIVDRIKVHDAIYTNGADKSGYVCGVEFDIKNDQIKLSTILSVFA